MKIYQLIAYQSDMSCGNSEHVLVTSKNKQQLDSIAKRFNKKYGSGPKATDYITEFSVTEIDTSKVKDSLTDEEINSLWN